MDERDRQILDAFIAECDAVGIGYNPAMLVKHHRANAQLIGTLAARCADDRHDGSARILSTRWTQVLERDDTADDLLTGRELARAAQCYMAAAEFASSKPGESMPAWTAVEYFGWPFDPSEWDPPADPVDCLALAGAFTAAEIDRLCRAATTGG